MRQCPSIVSIETVVRSAAENQAGLPDGRVVPARVSRSIHSPRTRLRAAWLVFTGRADALTWPGQPDGAFSGRGSAKPESRCLRCRDRLFDEVAIEIGLCVECDDYSYEHYPRRKEP